MCIFISHSVLDFVIPTEFLTLNLSLLPTAPTRAPILSLVSGLFPKDLGFLLSSVPTLTHPALALVFDLIPHPKEVLRLQNKGQQAIPVKGQALTVPNWSRGRDIFLPRSFQHKTNSSETTRGMKA